jgi:phage-related minor tail protein
MSDSATIGRGVLQIEVDASGAQAQLDTTSRSIEAVTKRIQEQAANIGKTKTELKLQELAQRGATQAQLDAYAAAQKQIEAYRAQQREARLAAQEAAAAGRAQAAAAALASGKLNTNQIAETGHAIRATIEMIASGQNPLRALASEGFRFSSIMGGVKEAFQALSSIFTVGRIAAGAIAAAVASVGYAFYEGAKQAREFNEAIIKTGNFAGQTGDSFNQLARTVAEATHSSVSDVRDLGMALLQSGEIPQQVFAKAAEAAANYARLTGKTAEEVAKDFVSMTEDPLKFAGQLNKSTGLVTSAQYQAIKAFAEHGAKGEGAGNPFYGDMDERANKLRESQGALGQHA